MKYRVAITYVRDLVYDDAQRDGPPRRLHLRRKRRLTKTVESRNRHTAIAQAVLDGRLWQQQQDYSVEVVDVEVTR